VVRLIDLVKDVRCPVDVGHALTLAPQ